VDLKPGDVIDDKYEVEGPPLGRGGMGVVYKALHRQLGTHVALKFLHTSLLAKADIVSRFRHEAGVGRRITSHHVARIQDLGTHEGTPFIVMEHLTGSDLDALLSKRGPLSVGESADFILQACEALHEAHALGIVHRDLKPSNLFITNGPDGLKVLDLGIAKSPFAERAARTATHAVIGSPFYMSPEQLTSSRSVDARTDLWSLGVILYQMLGDTVPFAGSSVMEIHEAIRERPWTPLSEHCEGLPKEIEELVSHALERDREKRIPNALAFATRLAPFGGEVAQESLARMRRMAARASGSPPAATPRATNAPPPSRRWMGGAALGILAVAGVGGGLAVWHPSTPISTTVPSAAPSASSPPLAESSATAHEPLAPSPPSASAAVASSAPRPSPRPKPACTGSATPECVAACGAHARGACESLATALVHGLGAPRDASRAATLYGFACDEGSLSACNSLGALYGLGDGVPHDDARAVGLYAQACDGGNVRGCANLGGMYFEGTGAPKNERRGADLFRRACEGGEAIGCKNLGIAYRDGRGVAKNADLARDFEAKSHSRDP
jgi:serine/threonine protein kinase